MMRYGITGPIGSGKSFVADRLQAFGYETFRADAEAKRLVEADGDVRAGVRALLGPRAYRADGSYDTSWVASRVFSDAGLLASLNGLVHPAVFRSFSSWCQAREGSGLVFFESALLPRVDYGDALDGVVVVLASRALRARRVSLRDGAGESEIAARMRCQGEAWEYRSIATHVIENEGTVESLDASVQGLLRELVGWDG